MIQRSIKRLSMRALVVDDELGTPTAEGRAARALVQELQGRAIEVVEATSAEDGTSVITSDSAIHAVLIDWTLGRRQGSRAGPRLPRVPALAQRQDPDLPDGRAWRSVGHPGRSDGDGRRVHLDARGHGGLRRRARRGGDPPLRRDHAASAGRGPDEVHAGIRVLLAHAGPHGRHRVSQVAGRPGLLRLLRREPAALGSFDQRREPWARSSITRARWASTRGTAARVFGAHRTYSVTNGTSMSNRVIFMAAVARDQIALCDRNCHKSIEHSLVMTGAIPNYLVPLRNRYGIIGPIPPERLSKEALKAAIKSNPLVTKGIDTRAVHSIITNSTYDGLCYNARRVRGAARPERRSHPFRRSLVRVRALQPALSRPPRDAWRSEGSQGSHDLRHAFDAQAAGRACRRRRCCTSATDAARSRIRDSTSRTCCMRRPRRCIRSSSRTTSRPR